MLSLILFNDDTRQYIAESDALLLLSLLLPLGKRLHKRLKIELISTLSVVIALGRQYVLFQINLLSLPRKYISRIEDQLIITLFCFSSKRVSQKRSSVDVTELTEQRLKEKIDITEKHI